MHSWAYFFVKLWRATAPAFFIKESLGITIHRVMDMN